MLAIIAIKFSSEFLRESKALYDNLYPSRIIVGTNTKNIRMVKNANIFTELLKEGTVDTLIMGFTEAEAVKLFANTYLALQVVISMNWILIVRAKGLFRLSVLDGITLDPRMEITIATQVGGIGDYISVRIQSNFW